MGVPRRAGEMRLFYCHLIFLLILVFCSSYGLSNALDDAFQKQEAIKVSLGAVVDCTTLSGKKERVAMEMAVKDIHSRSGHRQYLVLRVRNSRGDPIRAASAAKTLIQKNHARAIIGFKTWQEAAFVSRLGNESQVPILSLANETPLWASHHWPFLVSAARSVDAQMKAVAAIIHSWQWRKVNIIYEDFNPDDSGISPSVIDAIQEVDAKISDLLPLSPLTPYSSISKKLERYKKGQCRVFIVHTSIALGTKIFKEANEMGMMGKDYVWITTNAITSQIASLNASSISSMQGVLGVTSYFSTTKKRFNDFRSRFRAMFRLQYPNLPLPEPGTSTLQAYDAAWVVSLALGGNPHSRSHKRYLDHVCVGEINGEQLLEAIMKSNFQGLSGAFKFAGRKLAPVGIFRIANVVGKSYRELGYWTEGLGFSETVDKTSNYNKSMIILGQVFWPGGPWSAPKGWAIPTIAHQLKIGVPREATFKEFVNVRYDPSGGHPFITGFSVSVFKATLELLPYPLAYEFIPFEGTYDSLVEQIYVQKFDAVVGDTTIISQRCEYAEFSQPYTSSSLQMLIYNRPKRWGRAWLFKKPFTTTLWILTIVINVYNGFVVWVIERNRHPDFGGSVPNQIGTMLSLSFTTLFSTTGERLHSNLSRMTMLVWLFVALVVIQSFTASLTSLLTVQRLDPTKIDIETLKRSGAKVGCSGNSFVVKYLKEVLGFEPNNIKKFYVEDNYHQALMSGEIAVAFLEEPYVKIFLAKNCEGFITSEQTFKVGGLGFAFARSSPYVLDISKAVLEVSESGKLKELESSLTSSIKCSAPGHDDQESLGLSSFWGLFLITGVTSTMALLIFIFQNVHQRQCRLHSKDKHQERLIDEASIFGPKMENHYQPQVHSSHFSYLHP